mmetsp:Transcript_64846/g.146276  ORF Transcript_64846/g.146276 Transcript_64846/m.146276 type:complete len:404 (-) Transcript_64846:276-1487(-)
MNGLRNGEEVKGLVLVQALEGLLSVALHLIGHGHQDLRRLVALVARVDPVNALHIAVLDLALRVAREVVDRPVFLKGGGSGVKLPVGPRRERTHPDLAVLLGSYGDGFGSLVQRDGGVVLEVCLSGQVQHHHRLPKAIVPRNGISGEVSALHALHDNHFSVALVFPFLPLFAVVAFAQAQHIKVAVCPPDRDRALESLGVPIELNLRRALVFNSEVFFGRDDRGGGVKGRLRRGRVQVHLEYDGMVGRVVRHGCEPPFHGRRLVVVLLGLVGHVDRLAHDIHLSIRVVFEDCLEAAFLGGVASVEAARLAQVTVQRRQKRERLVDLEDGPGGVADGVKGPVFGDHVRGLELPLAFEVLAFEEGGDGGVHERLERVLGVFRVCRAPRPRVRFLLLLLLRLFRAA